MKAINELHQALLAHRERSRRAPRPVHIDARMARDIGLTDLNMTGKIFRL